MALVLVTSTSTTKKEIRVNPTMTIHFGRCDGIWREQLQKVFKATTQFYERHCFLIKESHGIRHVEAVHAHSVNAIECFKPKLSSQLSMEIQSAALLHDVDDRKYFPKQPSDKDKYPNARQILEDVGIQKDSVDNIMRMISVVSCSENGNTVPDFVKADDSYHLLIPRWSDRLEAVGLIGVVRCYQYNKEHGDPLWSDRSPRATTVEEVWEYTTPERFEQYQRSGGSSSDMISHYYDKLLHVAKPPSDIVRNVYLEAKAAESSNILVDVCLRFGRNGRVDEEHLQQLESSLIV